MTARIRHSRGECNTGAPRFQAPRWRGMINPIPRPLPQRARRRGELRSASQMSAFSGRRSSKASGMVSYRTRSTSSRSISAVTRHFVFARLGDHCAPGIDDHGMPAEDRAAGIAARIGRGDKALILDRAGDQQRRASVRRGRGATRRRSGSAWRRARRHSGGRARGSADRSRCSSRLGPQGKSIIVGASPSPSHLCSSKRRKRWILR